MPAAPQAMPKTNEVKPPPPVLRGQAPGQEEQTPAIRPVRPDEIRLMKIRLDSIAEQATANMIQVIQAGEVASNRVIAGRRKLRKGLDMLTDILEDYESDEDPGHRHPSPGRI